MASVPLAAFASVVPPVSAVPLASTIVPPAAVEVDLVGCTDARRHSGPQSLVEVQVEKVMEE